MLSSLRQAAKRMAQQTTRSRVYASAAFSTAGKQHASSTVHSVLHASKAQTTAAALFAAGVVIGMSPIVWAGSAEERSFIMIKPDGVNRGLVMDILKRFEQKGYKLVAAKVLVPSKELASKHYAEHDGKPFFPKLVDFLSSGAVVATVWEGKEVVKYGRTLIGVTNPLASAPGTIRFLLKRQPLQHCVGDFGIDVGRNIIHGSDGVESAQKEIALWFKPEELSDYNVMTKSAIYE